MQIVFQPNEILSNVSPNIHLENLSRIFPRVEIPGRSSVPRSSNQFPSIIRLTDLRIMTIIDPGQSLDFNTAFHRGKPSILTFFFQSLSGRCEI